MSKILIIGSSYSIKDTFTKKYINYNINFINFRKVWKNREISDYDIIIISGFDQKKISNNIKDIDQYINDYIVFVKTLKNKTKKIFLVSTFIPPNRSFSRVVYFYQKVVTNLKDFENIKILTFKKILTEKLKSNFFFKLLILMGISFTDQKELIKNTNNYLLKDIPKPKFFFLNVKRFMFFERILRIFDV